MPTYSWNPLSRRFFSCLASGLASGLALDKASIKQAEAVSHLGFKQLRPEAKNKSRTDR